MTDARATVGRAGTALALALAGCAAHHAPPVVHHAPAGPPPVCSLAREAGASRSVRTETWFRLLVQGNASEPRDCTGAAVRWDDGTTDARCLERAREPVALPPRPMSDDDIVLTRASGGRQIVWAITERLSDGEAVGVVALVDVDAHALNARAVGTLRARPGRARLRLVTVGGDEMLVAEGETCADAADVATCRRAIRLVPRRENRFVPRALTREADGVCVGPAVFDFEQHDTTALASGWARHFDATATLRFGEGAVTAHEQVVVQDADPNRAAIPPRSYRSADDDREVRVGDGTLRVTGVSLWARMHRAAASVAAP